MPLSKPGRLLIPVTLSSTDLTFETNNTHTALARRSLSFGRLDPASTPERAAVTRKSTRALDDCILHLQRATFAFRVLTHDGLIVRMQHRSILIEKVMHHGVREVAVTEILEIARWLTVCRTINRAGQSSNAALFRDGE